MVVYEEVSSGVIRAYSDKGLMIRGGYPEGLYEEAYDPADAHRTYVETDEYIPTSTKPQGRTFSKLRIVAALKAANVWDSVKTLLEQRDLYDLFLAAQDFSDTNVFFKQGKQLLQQELEWTDAQVETLLSSAEL